MTKTEELLWNAFAGESQTNRRYLAYAARAEEEGYPQVARFFRAAAESETAHAHNYLRALKGIRSTRENLEEALSVEKDAAQRRYPEMVEAARAEGNAEAERLFRYALESERAHALLLNKLLDAFGAPQEGTAYYVCKGCGHTVEKEAPKACPVCCAKGDTYKVFD